MTGFATGRPQAVVRRRFPAAAVAVLAGNACFVMLAFILHPRRSRGDGRTGWTRPGDGPVTERLASAALVAGWGLQLLTLARARRRTGAIRATAAITLLGAGLGLMVAAQRSIGSAWRTSVRGTGAAPLVTEGPYALVRHPAYTSMAAVLAANVVACPAALVAGGALLAFSGLELQVRVVEEPALVAAYGREYRLYAGQRGRFVLRGGRWR